MEGVAVQLRREERITIWTGHKFLMVKKESHIQEMKKRVTQTHTQDTGTENVSSPTIFAAAAAAPSSSSCCCSCCPWSFFPFSYSDLAYISLLEA